MRKSILIILLFVFTINMFSQGDEFYGDFEHYFEQSDIIENPTIQPPDVAAFQKVNFLPVNNYTGRVNVSIPIFTIKTGNITVPISLSYNSSGVKVNDRGSSVGLNWSLNAGGVISKIVKGMEDFTKYDNEYEVDVLDWEVSPVGWLFPEYIGFPISGNGATTYTGSYGDSNDHLPDLFIVSAPGLNTNYIHTRTIWSTIAGYNSAIAVNPKGVPFELTGQGNVIEETFGTPVVGSYDVFRQIPNSNNKEYYDGTYNSSTTLKCFEKIDITSTTGIKYSFNDIDVSQYSHFTEESPDATGLQSLWNQWKSERKVESYRLSTITDLKTNKNVQFEYQTYALGFYDPIDNKTYTYGDYQNDRETHSYSTKYPQLNRLTKITFDEGSVEFIYGLDRLDITGEKALTKVIIKNINGDTIKIVNLDHGYYQTPYSTVLPQSKRLRLDKVYVSNSNGDVMPSYDLTYNTTDLPLRGSWGQDFLGYNNGTYASPIQDPQPYIYFYPDKGIYSSLPFNNGSGYHQLGGNYTLESNLINTKSGILEKIEYPTGGFSEFEYELNKFIINGNEVEGGGLRLKSQKIVDENQNEQILDYEYQTTSGISSGSIVSLPKYTDLNVIEDKPSYPVTVPVNQTMDYFGFKIYIVSRSQAELTNNSFVGYSRVKVKSRIDNGYTIYDYSSPNEYPIELATQTTFNNDDYLTPDVIGNRMAQLAINSGKYSISIDRDVYRGKLKESTIFDKNNNLLIKTENLYTYKKFQEIDLDYEIKLNLEFDSYGQYRGYGILETAKLPSERYLLTSSKKTEFLPAGNKIETIINDYDADLPFLVRNEFSNSINEKYETLYTYANNSSVSGFPYVSNLLNQNRLSELFKKEIIFNTSNNILKEEYSYNDFGNGIINISELESTKGNSTKSLKSFISTRDSYGNVTESYTENGIKTVLIWGYYGEKLIVKIENIIYADVSSQVSNLQNLSNLDVDSASEEFLRTALDNFRDLTILSNSQVTTYTYDPLVGATSISDPSGYTSFYVYDEFNRIIYIKDKNGAVLKSYKYHYHDQVDPDLIQFYTLTNIIDGGLGIVSFNPSVVESGSYSDITATPSNGYEIDYIKVGTTNYPFTNNIARINNITADTEVHVKFKTLTTSLTVSPTILIFNSIDGYKTITVSASGSWTVSKSDSWIIISTTTGSGNGTFTIRPMKNLGDSRSGTVTVSDGSTTKIIDIEQAGSGGML